MIHIKSEAEIELMRKSALLVSKTHAIIASEIKPGVTTKYLDKLTEEFIRDNGGIPSFLNYNGFPFSACISVNDAVVHGFPNERELRDGDIISMDIGVYMNGFHGDSAYTFAIGNVDEEVLNLLKVTKESLYLGIEKAIAGNRVGDIGFAIWDFCEKKHGYGIVRELVGHGLGRKLHEDPQVPNYGKKGSGPKLKEGMTLAIEPMVNMGTKDVFYEDDGWTVKTKDGKFSAHFEHSICVRKNKADILSSFEIIEEAEKANGELNTSYQHQYSTAK